MVDVEQWAEIRRMYFVAGLSIKEIARRTGRDRNTIRRARRRERGELGTTLLDPRSGSGRAP